MRVDVPKCRGMFVAINAVPPGAFHDVMPLPPAGLILTDATSNL
jgi:hypothetical protein